MTVASGKKSQRMPPPRTLAAKLVVVPQAHAHDAGAVAVIRQRLFACGDGQLRIEAERELAKAAGAPAPDARKAFTASAPLAADDSVTTPSRITSRTLVARTLPNSSPRAAPSTPSTLGLDRRDAHHAGGKLRMTIDANPSLTRVRF